MLHKKSAIAALLAVVSLPALAAPEKYTIDPDHTFPSIEFSHLGISVWRGKFDKTRGNITLDRTAKTGTVDIVVDTASINWGLDSMNEHSRKADWFDAAKYPTATYKGTIKFDGNKPKSVDGQLTVKGITRPVPLTLNLFNCIPHPMLKKEVCGADAEGTVHWSDFGMKKWPEDAVRLRIQVEALKQD